MDLGIKNKIMIVIGGSKGIGEGITKFLANEGAIPVIASRDKRIGEELVEKLKRDGKESYFIQVELSSIEKTSLLLSICSSLIFSVIFAAFFNSFNKLR